MGRGGTTRRLAVAVALVLAAAGCSGADTEAGVAAQQLADSLTTPDAAALRALVADERSAVRTDLLVDEVVGRNALAGRGVEIEADVSRYNGYGTFTITSPDVPDLRLPVTNRLNETRTPGALRSVAVRADRELNELLVDADPVPVDPAVPAGTQVMFALPPGEWSLSLPEHPYVETSPQTVTVLDRPEPANLLLSSRLNADGEAEAIRQADAVVAACERPTDSPESGCGGPTSLCVGATTTRTVVFSERPVWTVEDTTISHQATLRRTVTTVCTDRDGGAVVDRTSSSGPARLDGSITLTATGLSVQLG